MSKHDISTSVAPNRAICDGEQAVVVPKGKRALLPHALAVYTNLAGDFCVTVGQAYSVVRVGPHGIAIVDDGGLAVGDEGSLLVFQRTGKAPVVGVVGQDLRPGIIYTLGDDGRIVEANE